MVNTDSIRLKIEKRIFSDLGSSATISAFTSGSTDKWGDDNTSSYASSIVISIVPWNHVSGQQVFQEFGDLNKGEMDFAVKYDQSVSVDDRIGFGGKTFLVKQVLDFKLKDAVLVRAVRVVEEL